MALVFLRHTTPDVAEGVCYGMTDLALRPTFKAECAVVLRDLPRVERIISSPLSRCYRLAAALGEALALTVSIDERLREMDFGRWEGQRWDQINRGDLDLWAEDFMHARPHGGESVYQLQSRVRSAMGSYGELPGDSLLVTHAGVIKAAFAKAEHSEAFEGTTPFGGMRRWPEAYG
ncbi:MAG: histidine phosphatase family protein [Pseudomonadota bacterium]